MPLGEYLSVPFLISLGITLLLVGIIGMFFTQRLQEQNHKINSMVGLISTMAEELGYLRNKLTQNDDIKGALMWRIKEVYKRAEFKMFSITNDYESLQRMTGLFGQAVLNQPVLIQKYGKILNQILKQNLEEVL